MMKTLSTIAPTLTNPLVAYTQGSVALDLKHAEGYTCVAAITVSTPSAKTFTDGSVTVVGDLITITTHGMGPGLIGQLTTTGTLPAGLATSTNYYVIVVDANTIKLASSLVNCQAGTAVDITAAAGGGTHTFTATALAGGTVKPQWSIDGTTFIDQAAAQNVTVTANFSFNDNRPFYRYFRLLFTLTAGQITPVLTFMSKE